MGREDPIEFYNFILVDFFIIILLLFGYFVGVIM